MGSVKDLVIIKEAKGEELGEGRFVFSDRYSVFDWGEMPNHISNKGKAICISTAYFLEKLEAMGIKTHYLGLLEDGELKSLDSLKKPSNILGFKLLRVLRTQIKDGKYDYSIYKKEKVNFLIPLEVIYRNSLPKGSSVFERLKEGSLTLEDLDLKEMPEIGKILEKPIIDFSTKLESTDRYLKRDEAIEISGLSEDEFEKMVELSLKINSLITEETNRMGLFNEDGKFEFGFDEKRNIILVDALGTLDECRFTYGGIPVSKEIARIFYRKTDWFKSVEEAKKIDKINWKKFVKSVPPSLPDELSQSISLVYQAYANELTGREWFPAPSIKEILEKIKRYTEK
ncbi:MAG: phosphoribosylaminoimidazolesuccinocarboxamide synthase [Candidatus Aminicenantia bacterium]